MTAAAETAPFVVEPGVHDIPFEEYHAGPLAKMSLSSSGARRLLATCPKKFRYEQDHPEAPTRAMELGTAAHREVLGVGSDIVPIEYSNYRTKAAQAARDEARAAGGVPLLPHEVDQVEAMAAALRGHELASALLGGTGRAEQAIVWQDKPTRIWRRALLDWLPAAEPGGRMYVADYKKALSAHPDAISTAIERYGYHAQGAWYTDGITALGLADEVAFFLVVQEPDPPYLVSVVQLDQVAMDAGRHENRKAINLYARCVREDRWPPYVEGVQPVGLPPWAENRFLKEVTS